MTPPSGSLRRVAELFEQLVDLAPAQQEVALRKVGENDPVVEAEVRRLLRVDREVPCAEQEPAAEPVEPSRFFGAYRAIRPIGEGGMGTVYLAERSDGQFARLAAVKVIQGSLATEAMRVRFLTERQILANLVHPGIATLLDGGVTSTGEPYLVMDYIEGLPLDVYCDQNRLTQSQRLALFLEVCSAVDFAHRHLIIHRDLKPSNVLVGADGKAKLLDFGAAKLLGPMPTDRTREYLTPRYSSPEQMRGEPATVAMDVYSLGVMLYELLTGQWPFGDPIDVVANYRRATEDVAPLTPAAAVVPGDLTAILFKALDSEVTRRYPNVAELIADIERFRAGRPVLARPQTAVYRLRKWVSRNPLQTVAVLLAIAGVAVGLGLREQQRIVAERRFDELRHLARFQIFDLQEQMYFYGSPLQVRKRMAERSMLALEQLSSESAPNFALQADLTEGFTQLAELLGNPLRSNLGEPQQGRKALDQARRMNEVLQSMSGPARLKQAAQAKVQLQEAMYDLGTTRTAEKLAIVQKSMEAWEAATDLASQTPEDIGRMAMMYLVLAVNQGQTLGTVDMFRRERNALPSARRLIEIALAKNPTSPMLRFTGLQIGVHEAEDISNEDNDKGRRRLLEMVREIDAFDGAEPNAERVRFLRGRTYGALGWLEGQMKLFDPALDHLKVAAMTWRGLLDSNPTQINLRYEVAGVLRDLGFVYGYAKRHLDAAKVMGEAVEEYRRLHERTKDGRYLPSQGELLIRIGAQLAAAGRKEEARPSILQGQDILYRLAESPDATPRSLMLASRYSFDVPLADCRHPAKGLELALRVDRLVPNDAATTEILTQAYAAAGKRKEAFAALEKFRSLVPKSSTIASTQAKKLELDIESLLRGEGIPVAAAKK
jgi:serine/threonine protein kinase